MSINHSAGCADANECFFTPRAEATGTLGYRSLIIFVLSIISWALVVAIVVALLEAGAVVLPAIPSFYSNPKNVSDVVDTVVWRILDQLGLPNPRAFRWQSETAGPPRS